MMTAADVASLLELIAGSAAVVCFGLGYIGGYLQ